ncbi:MAG: signal peptidase I [Fimbriimonadales bacterium]
MEVELPQTVVEAERPRPSPTLRAIVRFSLLSIFVLLAVFAFNFQTVIVAGNSMLPTLRDRERLLVCKALWLVGPPRESDIVVVRTGTTEEFIVKRVIGVAGTIVPAMLAPMGWNVGQGDYRVPEGKVYIVGDNLDGSEDSRTFGPVLVSDVLGKVVRY